MQQTNFESPRSDRASLTLLRRPIYRFVLAFFVLAAALKLAPFVLTGIELLGGPKAVPCRGHAFATTFACGVLSASRLTAGIWNTVRLVSKRDGRAVAEIPVRVFGVALGSDGAVHLHEYARKDPRDWAESATPACSADDGCLFFPVVPDQTDPYMELICLVVKLPKAVDTLEMTSYPHK